MSARIYRELRPVRRRQREVLMVRATVLGLLAGSLAGIGLGIWKWTGGHAVSTVTMVAVLAGGPIVGMIVGALWRKGWNEAASAVDSRYALKDRTVTALDFMARKQTTLLQELEVADAEEHLSTVKPTDVAPFRIP